MPCDCTTARERRSCFSRDVCEDDARALRYQEETAARRQAARDIVDALSGADESTLQELRDLLAATP